MTDERTNGRTDRRDGRNSDLDVQLVVFQKVGKKSSFVIIPHDNFTWDVKVFHLDNHSLSQLIQGRTFPINLKTKET